jgi:hypothetical protein
MGVWTATARPENAFQIIEGGRRPSLTNREENRHVICGNFLRRDFVAAVGLRNSHRGGATRQQRRYAHAHRTFSLQSPHRLHSSFDWSFFHKLSNFGLRVIAFP